MSWRGEIIWLHWQQTVAVCGCCSQASGFYGLARCYYHSFLDTLRFKKLWYENSNPRLLSVPLDPNQGEPEASSLMLIRVYEGVVNDWNWREINTPVGSWLNQFWSYLNQGKKKSLKKNKWTVTDLACTGRLKRGAFGIVINAKRHILITLITIFGF